MRYNSDGTLDAGFGKVTTDFAAETRHDWESARERQLADTICRPGVAGAGPDAESAGWSDVVKNHANGDCEEEPVRIGIVGAGMIGSTLAKLWVDAGHDVHLASRHPEQLQGMIERLGSRVSAGTAAQAAAFGQVVMLTVPLKAVPDLAHDLAPLLAGKVVLDTAMPTRLETARSRK